MSLSKCKIMVRKLHESPFPSCFPVSLGRPEATANFFFFFTYKLIIMFVSYKHRWYPRRITRILKKSLCWDDRILEKSPARNLKILIACSKNHFVFTKPMHQICDLLCQSLASFAVFLCVISKQRTLKVTKSIV